MWTKIFLLKKKNSSFEFILHGVGRLMVSAMLKIA